VTLLIQEDRFDARNWAVASQDALRLARLTECQAVTWIAQRVRVMIVVRLLGGLGWVLSPDEGVSVGGAVEGSQGDDG